MILTNESPEIPGRFNAPYFFVPRYIEFVADLPYTPTNKVQKFKLRAQGLSASAWDRAASDFKLER